MQMRTTVPQNIKTDSIGLAVSPHPAATRAGQEVLDAGGNAAEAAVAMNAVLAVVYPHFCGLGGDAVWIMSDGAGTETCLLGIGQAIEAASTLASMSNIPLRGAGSVLTTAAAVDSWAQALAEWGATRSISDLLSPAISLAENGFEVSGSQAHWLAFREGETGDWPGFDALFRRRGHTPCTGEVSRFPELARSLTTLATEGLQSFYTGSLAQRVINGLNGAGVPMTSTDLANTRTQKVRPLRQGYRGLTLLAPPPPTQGVTTLQIMGILQNFNLSDLAQEGSVEHVHTVVEAVKRAFKDRSKIADPDFAALETEQFLNGDYLAQLAQSITSQALPWPDRFSSADTVYFGAVDGQGRCASVLQSTYFDWGSGVVAGDTGILWQNRGAAFNTDPTHPNAIAPGKRPFYTLNPGMALENGKPRFLYGTQGADGQPQTLAMILTRLIDFGRSPSEALAGGRFLLGRTFSDSNDTLKLEAQLGDPVVASLKARGHEVAQIPAFSPLAGQAGIIQINTDGTLNGCHDPRGGDAL